MIKTAKKGVALLLSLLLMLTVFTAAQIPAAAQDEHSAVYYVYNDLVSYGPDSAMFLTAGAQFYVRQEIDGEPAEPPILASPYVTVDPTPVLLGPDVFGRPQQQYYRCTVSENVPECMAMSGGFLMGFEDPVFCKSCATITAEKKELVATTKDGKVYHDGDTVVLQPGETVLLSFDLTGGAEIPSSAWSTSETQFLVPGWFADGLRCAGFTVPEDPVFEGDMFYASVSAGEGLAAGTQGVLPVRFVQQRHVFGENAIGWENAMAVYRGDLYFKVAGEQAVKPGDVDGDGEVSAMDARYALRRSVDLEDYSEGSPAFLACDVDGDGIVTATDARLILRASVGLEDLEKLG
ncbi:MAG: dockerin type I repeat-containing protein [Clostridia bacterium]|nr:dockerin type I repeat-containing protein [Clostridia bacterium]